MALNQLPFLILDCYYDEKGAAPNFRALLHGAPSETVRVVSEPLPRDLACFAGILITGSKANLPSPEPWMPGLLKLVRAAHGRDLPVLGICFGHQAIAAAVAGLSAVRKAPKSELGWITISLQTPNPILRGLQKTFTCFVSHFDEVVPGTPGLVPIASSERCKMQGFQVEGQRSWGLQFHPEMDPGESEDLVRSNARRHASLGRDAQSLMREALDGRELGRVIVQNFIGICRGTPLAD